MLMRIAYADPPYIGRSYLSAAVVAMFLLVLLTACTSAPVIVTRSCIVPNELDYEAQGPKLLEVKPTDPDDHLMDEANERHEHHLLALDYNALRNHVKQDCQ